MKMILVREEAPLESLVMCLPLFSKSNTWSTINKVCTGDDSLYLNACLYRAIYFALGMIVLAHWSSLQGSGGGAVYYGLAAQRSDRL